MRTLSILACCLLLTACPPAVDTDGDGLMDHEEEELGTDPSMVDTDGDGLEDGEEVALGTDATSTDSDGDGYLDNHEIDEGSDPVDPDSRIYTGGWPYNPDKDDMAEGGWTVGLPQAGDRFPRYRLMDQYGEEVDFYDFAGHGKMILYDISAEWCGPCNSLAAWLDGAENSSYADYEGIRQAVHDGEVFFLTMLVDAGEPGVPADLATLERWHTAYPTETVPVMADPDRTVSGWVRLQGYPTVGLLDENFDVVMLGSLEESRFDVFDELTRRMQGSNP